MKHNILKQTIISVLIVLLFVSVIFSISGIVQLEVNKLDNFSYSQNNNTNNGNTSDETNTNENDGVVDDSANDNITPELPQDSPVINPPIQEDNNGTSEEELENPNTGDNSNSSENSGNENNDNINDSTSSGNNPTEDNSGNTDDSDNNTSDDNLNDNQTENNDNTTNDGNQSNDNPSTDDTNTQPEDNPSIEGDDDKNETSDGTNNPPNYDNEKDEESTVELTVRDKVFKLISNSDYEIYKKFEYFLTQDGMIDSSKVELVSIESELDELCERLLISISAKFGNVSGITNEMNDENDSINNLLKDIRDLLIANAKRN